MVRAGQALDKLSGGDQQGARRREDARDDRGHAERLHPIQRQYVFKLRYDRGLGDVHHEGTGRPHRLPLPHAGAEGESRACGPFDGRLGTMRLGVKSPDVLSSVYGLSPCCMEPGRANPAMKEMMKKVEALKTDEEVKSQAFFVLAMLASAAAWSPNPKNPPFYIDLPFRDGEQVPDVQARQSANATLVMAPKYIPNLKRLKFIGMDAGTKDTSISAATKELDKILTDYGVAHFYESYDGDHLNRIAERLQTKTLPFFSEHLSFEKVRR